MQELYTLKEKLMDEIKEYATKGDLSAGDLGMIDTLTHATKNLCKIIEDMGEGYSERYYRDSYRGGSYGYRDGSYRDGGSYRGRARDSMGRYVSSEDELSDKLTQLMEETPNEKIKVEFRKLISKLEQM